MDKLRVLSGSELVAKGATKKVDGQLPQTGLKEVLSNGSWLEQKQIQSALEARKHLIAVERIEKSGSLSHAEWRDDLKLAEVTKQTGGHWQYIGHQKGKTLYLLPEETLFLMEVNSLLLKHNEVTVSLQKAYALCLTDMPLMQYKVYASLSRLGYKVFRHKEHNNEKSESTAIQKVNSSVVQIVDKCDLQNNARTHEKVVDTEPKDGDPDMTVSAKAEGSKMEIDDNNGTQNTVENSTNATEVLQNGVTTLNKKTDNINKSLETTNITESLDENNTIEVILNKEQSLKNTSLAVIEENVVSSARVTLENVINSGIVYSIDEVGVARPGEKLTTLDAPMSAEIYVPNSSNNENRARKDIQTQETCSNERSQHYQIEINHYDQKIQKLSERKSAEIAINHKALDTIQDLYKERIVDVNVPEEKYLPRNIFLHKTAYRLNMDVVRNQNAANVSSDEMESESPSLPNTQIHTYPQNYENFNTINTPSRYPNFRCAFDRPQYYRQHYNMYRTPLQNYYVPRWNMRQQYMAFQANRRDTMRTYHYNTIVNIAMRFKNGFVANASQIRALHNLLNTYNLRYNATISVTPDFNIIDNKYQPQPEQTDDKVIVLNDEPKPKKPRLNEEVDKTKTNLEKLKELATKLKELHAKNLASSRHRRVFSNAINSYNKSFKADLYLNSNFEIIDRSLVVIDSSSDTEVVVKEKERPRKKKRLRNPYNILKNAAKYRKSHPSTSLQDPDQRPCNNDVSRHNSEPDQVNTVLIADESKGEGLLKYFDKAWLPPDDDFGRAEPCPKQKAQLDALLYQAEYLYDILKESNDFDSWKDIKLSVLKEIRGSLDVQKQQAEALSNDFYMETESQIRPIISDGCTDLKSALQKLAIVPTNKEIPKGNTLRIHFDVCNRDVPFKKSNPPKPNFRVVCYEESSPFPPSMEVAALQARYEDGIPTVFAFVGDSASITYLQIKPIDLPVFIPDGLV